jgi:4-hydroxy-3-polyprenylbenzoate decarboxylase
VGNPLPEDARGSIPQALSSLRQLLVAIAGPTGVIYGIRLLERLRDIPDISVHLVLSDLARRAIPIETDYALADVQRLSDHVLDAAAPGVPSADGMMIAACDGMVIAPCDIATAAAVADGPTSDLIPGAAAEMLGGGRPLTIVLQHSPLGVGDLRTLLRLAERGAVVLPPAPAFYNRPQEVEHIVLHTVARVMDRLGLCQSFAPEWLGSQLRP